MHTCNANTLEVEAGGSEVQSHSQTLGDCEHKLLRPFLNKRKEAGEGKEISLNINIYYIHFLVIILKFFNVIYLCNADVLYCIIIISTLFNSEVI